MHAGRCRPDFHASTVHLMAASPDEAGRRARGIHKGDDGLNQGSNYRITSVQQVLPEPGEIF
ncbi:hypothetical protein SAM23877_7664 [Streptomyces ambofaciens ATCC 23877]|uniref:Uncharacterized protein n=1 Tax=Streptomyces ambofaciens (strain ATCC 23877 / 3486 / DSM 40053 / JCM 4204 / NBRC 12836 / NRRL B-2516) TaxID=278992 RepID=A0A0K2AJ93_STRA7|nr:hypothetical protein SAM23877_0005 [Streptomyces ambofaciens ATCC 23877]AKZ60705.1 hypothetical protein SAM23877_7664 [Streptomyces ambofaciens ATCC 23877]